MVVGEEVENRKSENSKIESGLDSGIPYSPLDGGTIDFPSCLCPKRLNSDCRRVATPKIL